MMHRNWHRKAQPVIRISLPWMIEVTRAVDALSIVKTGDVFSQHWPAFYNAKHHLELLFDQSLYSTSLFSSRQSGQELLATLDRVMKLDFNQNVIEMDSWVIKNQSERFSTVFMAELGTLPSYYVLPKGAYNTNMLLDAGETLMPVELSTKVPEAVYDAKEAAKALAFELGTSCGFHTFRVLESVVRRYHKEASGGEAPPKQRNLGVYIRVLKKCEGTEKIVAALTQIKDLHRNPLIHPHVAIPSEEAISILGMVRSAVTAMLNELPESPHTTTTAP